MVGAVKKEILRAKHKPPTHIGLMAWIFCTRQCLMHFAIDVVKFFGVWLVGTNFLFLEMIVHCVPRTFLGCH